MNTLFRVDIFLWIKFGFVICSSGPCMTIAVTKPGEDIGKDLIPEFRSLIGPADVNMAKEEAPER